MTVPVPPNEEERLRALSDFEILDSGSEAAFDDIVKLAAMICEVPVAAVSLVDRSRVWLKAVFGASVTEVPRPDSLCSYTILDANELLVIEDATTQTRFPGYQAENSPDVVFYAGAPLVTKEGYVLGSLCVVAPFSRTLSAEQREALKALASQALAQLELRQTVRQLKAKTEELDQALNHAEASNLAKSVFLANMSHEVRTPLSGVIGMAEILAATPLSERQRRYVDAIRRSGEGLLGMLNDVLEVVQSEGNEPSLSDITTASLLDELVGMMQPAAEAKRLWIDLQIDPALNQPLRADALRLRQVLTSLLANAIRFTEKGWIQVRAEAFGRPANGHQKVRFDIQDSGIGMSPELQVLVLNSSEADMGTARVGGGLGLALCRRLLANMKSELSLVSEPGAGSTFSFTLDLELVSHSSGARPRRVLVVEDNEVNSMVISAMLEQNGCEVECVENGLLAVDILSREQFDMVFMDLHMPEMDGVTATKRVRAMESTGRTPIVAVTASAFTEEEARCRDAGMDGLIRKPINERLVREALVQYAIRS